MCNKLNCILASKKQYANFHNAVDLDVFLLFDLNGSFLSIFFERIEPTAISNGSCFRCLIWIVIALWAFIYCISSNAIYVRCWQDDCNLYALHWCYSIIITGSEFMLIFIINWKKILKWSSLKIKTALAVIYIQYATILRSYFSVVNKLLLTFLVCLRLFVPFFGRRRRCFNIEYLINAVALPATVLQFVS